MGTIKPVQPAKLFFGLLAASEQLLAEAKARLAYDFSAIERVSAIIPFDLTDYYAPEMGGNLLRQWVSVAEPVPPEALVAIKHYTNQLEGLWSSEGRRRVNIDPGYLNLSKVVLATTKDHSHRVYAGRGIYEEVTLAYRRGQGYVAWPWTYPDYRSDAARQFFLEVRADLDSLYRRNTISN
jgi:hypothetical protein